MYWNDAWTTIHMFRFQINRNMRCIETDGRRRKLTVPGWLIETWDVLKPFSSFCVDCRCKINRNMRCIETIKIARNSIRRPRLIETWDVLKPYRDIRSIYDTRLIETWDVLKHLKIRFPPTTIKINRNMRCIETR